ncbi:hypothetical protein EDC04DRAFT_2613709 [Pisolithus marmoratus]|nr:hypothetical protein EDC04DRAFT_2613709 [Pisolithus marmoratus]
MTSSKFNITLRMLHLQSFNWFKQFAEGAILMDMALDSIEFTLGSNFDHDEWMDLAYCVVMEPDCWCNIERAFMQKLGIRGSSSELNAPLPDIYELLCPCPQPQFHQESAFMTPVIAGPLLKDPSAWHLMMDWAQDKFGYSKLDDKMVMELQGICLTADSTPAPLLGPSTSSASTLSQGATCHHHLSSSGATQKKHYEGINVDDVCKDEEGNGKERSICYPQQVGPLGKGSFLCNIDILCKQFDHGTQESVAIRSPIDPQIPAGIFLPPLKNIYIVNFYSASARTFAIEYMKKSQVLEAMTLPWLPLWLYVEASCPLKVQQNLPPSHHQCHKDIVLLLPQEESTEGKAVMLITPHQLPYDSPEESGERMRFDVKLARVADLDLVPILASSGVEISYSCNGHQFVHGLLRLPLLVNTLELVEVPHPDDIRFHAAAGIDPLFIKQMLNLFSAQFWAFSTGDTVEFIAGPFCGERGYVVTLHEHTIILVIMQPDKTSETVEVSRFVMQSHLQEHILSLSPAENALQSAFPLSGDEALLGDIIQVHHVPFAGQGGIIEWISPNSKVWVSKSGKDRGYNVAVGNTMEVARGQWHHSKGIVKTVDLTKASLDIINVPIMFVCKIKEHFDHGLSQFVGHDVWIVAGDKKGCWAMLHSLGRMLS